MQESLSSKTGFRISPQLWVLLALLAASIEPIIAKFAFKDGAGAFQLVVLKNVLGGLFVLPVLLKLNRTKDLFKPALGAGLLLFVTNTASLLSLKTLSVVLFITIVTCVPAFVAILNSILGRERLGPVFWLGFLLCFAGVSMTLDYQQTSLDLTGLLFSLAAALSSSFYRVRMEIICEKHSPAASAALSYFVQAPLSLLLVGFALPYSVSTVLFGSYIALAAALANLAFIYALSLVGSTRISILTMLQRPLLILFAALVLKETVSTIQIIGIVLVMIGIQLAQSPKRVGADTESVNNAA